MSEKRRGLGRGLGALIPNAADAGSAAPATRPVDLFFPAPQRNRDQDGAKDAAGTGPLSKESAAAEEPQKPPPHGQGGGRSPQACGPRRHPLP